MTDEDEEKLVSLVRYSSFQELNLTESLDVAILSGVENILLHCRWDCDKALLRESLQ